MFRKFYPYAYTDSVFDIDYKKLYNKGFKGILFDIDNTLVHHGDDSNEQIDDLFFEIQKIGLKTLILSNNSELRIQRFLKNINSLYISNAEKPNPYNYKKAIEMLNISADEVVCIGDQIFTDILGANQAGIASILVHFIQEDGEMKIGKRRYLEKCILWFYRKNKNCYNRLGDIKRGKKNVIL